MFPPDILDFPACQNCGNIFSSGTTCAFCSHTSSFPYSPFSFTAAQEIERKTIFVIDAAINSRSNDFLGAVLRQISHSRAQNCAIVLVTNHVTFLLPHNRIGVISDLSDPLFPPHAFLKTVPESLDILLKFPHRDRGPDIVPALLLLSQSVGKFGKISLFLGSVPTGEISFSRLSVEAESAALRGPNFSDHFQKIVNLLQKQEAVFDIFIDSLAVRLIDCATFAKVAAATGGCVNYVNLSQKWCLEQRISSHLASLDVKCSIRLSQGELLPSLGLFQHSPNNFRISIPTSVVFPLKLPPQLNHPIIAQAIVQFRDLEGHLRVRVFAHAFEFTEDISVLFENANCGAVLKYATNFLISSFYNNGTHLIQTKTILLNVLKPIFESYRYHVSRTPNRLLNLVMPSSLEFLPKYSLGVLKSTAFNPGICMDERGWELFYLNRMDPQELLSVAYPFMFDLTRVLVFGEEPIGLPLTERELLPTRILILFDGFGSYVWLGSKVDRELCMKLFNKPTTYSVERLELLDTEESRKMYSLLKGNVRLFVGTGKGITLLFQDRLVEDSGSVQCSYMAWVMQLNRISRPANTSYPGSDD